MPPLNLTHTCLAGPGCHRLSWGAPQTWSGLAASACALGGRQLVGLRSRCTQLPTPAGRPQDTLCRPPHGPQMPDLHHSLSRLVSARHSIPWRASLRSSLRAFVLLLLPATRPQVQARLPLSLCLLVIAPQSEPRSVP